MTPTNNNTDNIDNNTDNNNKDNNNIHNSPINEETSSYQNIYRNNINNEDRYSLLFTYINLFVEPLKKLIVNLRKNIADLTRQNTEKDKTIEELTNECCVCLMDNSQYIFIPCGHFCLCNTCTAQYRDHDLNFCPVCKRHGETFRVFRT